MGPQDEADDTQHLHRRERLLTGGLDRRHEGEVMFQKISAMWVGLSKIDIALVVMSCVAIGALSAAILS